MISTNPVCVTGVSGFVGSQTAAELLAAGYRVRGTVRDPERSRTEGLLADAPGAERLELVAADLMQPESFIDAVAGCEYVIHTASPYVLEVDDPQRDLVDPAVNGTTAVLQASLAAGVKRVVVTSSLAAVTDQPDGRVLTEADWNEASTLTRNPYYYSKTLAERAAHAFVEANPIEVVVVNPGPVFGPSLVPSLNETNRILTGLADGTFPAVLALQYLAVDVRDVAAAHRLAMETPGASGRYLCAAGVRTLRELRDQMATLGVSKVPRMSLDRGVGIPISKLVARFQPAAIRQYLLTNLGGEFRIDNSRIREELGMTFRPIDDTIADTVADLRRWGHLES
ncbi:MAG: NAD-dependent epimerase/dehydratase family protein [Acidimicrobiia bacterium]